MEDIQLKCVDCGKEFVFSTAEQAYFESKALIQPKRCKECRKKRKAAIERTKQNHAEKSEKAIFNDLVKEFYLVDVKNIRPNMETVLYIIGNGFDMMHGVSSSYYSFAASLGKNNALRHALETYLNVDNLWSDFEDALAHLNVSMMLNTDVVDMWLDDFGAYDPDAQAADFFAAVDTVTEPASEITSDLPRRFRMWVESLSLKDPNHPLKELIVNGKVLDFNYTEFIEQLYGVDQENVCYIHGCRRKKKGHPKEKLILGHQPGAGEEEWDAVEFEVPHFKNRYKREMMEAAYDTAVRNLNWYDDETTKKSTEIIKNHQDFFAQLQRVDTIVVIGHSLSFVDWDYFREVIRASENNLKWYISCHSADDLKRLKKFCAEMKIDKANVAVFIT